LTLIPVAQGIAASVIAILIACSWIALGSVFLDSEWSDDEVAAPAAILIGSGITSCVLAVLAAIGYVRIGTIVVATMSVGLLAVRRRVVIAYIKHLLQPYRTAFRNRAIATIGLATGLILWVATISPPRSADAMRYHLAHIRQIVQDGRWAPIADYHYALPFGWSLSYLPFELLHLPQGSQLLGLVLFMVFVSSLVRGLRRCDAHPAAVMIALLLVLHPAVLRVFTEANADAYALLIVLVIVLLLLRLDHFNTRDTGLLGFASFIGLQSRYQLGAAAIAATVIFVIAIRDHPGRRGAYLAFIGGASCALCLASPFYIANEVRFDNAIWPLFIHPQSPGASYADTVAYTYSRSLTGSYAPSAVAHSIVDLLRTPYLFPLGVVIPAIIGTACLKKGTSGRIAGMFGVIFLAEWLLMQPLLYPRFILLMLPVAAVCAGLLLCDAIQSRPGPRKLLAIGGSAAAALLAAAFAFVNGDSLRYVVRDDAADFHRYTWYYRTYDWVNHNTPRDARLLVIVSSAHTYYLDRPYRRADPWLSGVVDWRAVDTGAKLDSVLALGNYSYVVYENRDWSLYPSGSNTGRAVDDAYRSGLLRNVASFVDTLYTSRFRGTFRVTQVNVAVRSSPRRH
jgi:hypothetical protein